MDGRPTGVGVEVQVTPTVSYAMAHCGVPFVQRIVVRSSETVALEDIVVRAGLVDAQGGLLSLPWQHHVESVRADVPLVIERPGVRLDPRAVASLEEETTADIEVCVTVGSGTVTTTRSPVRVLAARQWTMDPGAAVLSLELLAAFVQPNHPAVAPVVTRAADLLERHTGSGSLAVAEVSPSRRDAIVESVLDAVLELGVHYAEPPASWGYGQKVRGPGDVFEGRVGGCLDTTLALAACLEHVGITPVLWVARGHAFLGYWRTGELGLPDAASLQVASAANAVDLGRMGVLESTMVTRERRPPRDLFRRATQAPLDEYFQRADGELVGVVDVGTARLMGILPMPAQRLGREPADLAATPVIEVSTDAATAAPVASSGTRTIGGQSGSTYTGEDGTVREPAPSTRPVPPPRVEAWKNALLDLTLRNTLLNLGAPMTMAPLVVPGGQLGLLSSLLQEGRTLSVRASDDLSGAAAAQGQRDAYALPGDVQRAMLAQRATVYSGLAGDAHTAAMQRLRYRARTMLQETGANPLYVTVGRFDWQLGDRRLSAPLLLAPVEIKGVVMPFRVAFDESGAVTLNHSLMEKLRLEFGFSVPGLDGRTELPTLPGTSVVDVDAVLTRVREAIALSGLPFRVESEARLAIVAFTGYLLWRDLDAHWESFLERPLVRHLALTPTDSFARGEPPSLAGLDLDDVVAGSPVPTDGAQAHAVAAARAGGTFVLEGPPGTGKSQTITGIIADQLAHGRTVLFVAEKGAALEVVRRRLAEVGLLPFALDLHDENARPNEVRARLRTALAIDPHADTDGYRLAAQDVAATGAVLEGYAQRLLAPNASGLSLYTAHSQRLAHGPGPTLDVPQEVVGSAPSQPAPSQPASVEPPQPNLRAVRRAVAAAVPLLAAVPPSPSPAWGFATAYPGDDGMSALWPGVRSADAAVAAACRATENVGAATRSAVLAVRTNAELEVVAWLLSHAATDPGVITASRSDRWARARADLDVRTTSSTAAADDVFADFDADVVGVDDEPVRLKVRQAAGSFFIGRKGRLLAAAEPILAHALPGSTVDPKRLPDIVERVAVVSQEARSLAAAWRELPGCDGLAVGVNPLSPHGWQAVAAAVNAVDRDRAFLDRLPSELGDQVLAARSGDGPVSDAAYEAFVAARLALAAVFDLTQAKDADVQRFSRGRGLLRTWVATQDERSDDAPRGGDLGRWLAAGDALHPVAALLPEARWQLLTGEVPAEDATAALERGLSGASVSERWAAGGFRAFDADRQDRSVARFVSSSDALRTSLATALPEALVERRPFRAGALFGTVGQLEREVGRSRGGLSVRRLVERYGDVIAAVTPCVLVSPDSLARFIPPGAMTFDLVVFDEASQITVADAIGALGRAEAAVIAGDSKQMPPSSFGQASVDAVDVVDAEQNSESDGDAEFRVVADEESILGEAVQAGVNRLWLSWHYRSRDESLIAFSNAAYYEDRLSSFPAHPDAGHDTGVSFVRVQGTFIRSHRVAGPAVGVEVGPQDRLTDTLQDRPADGPQDRRDDGPRDRRTSRAGRTPDQLRTNPVEAAAVVAEVLRRWALGERSIGVVTFNIQQRSLVEQLLWDSGVEGVAESLAARQDGLFVKNLENVQGDERDVILFSTGFSATARGVLPLNFGPLNRSGGERRLNVAVTRARRRVIVFSSFDPEDLRVEQTSSVGIRDLRRYLEVAKYGVSHALGDVARVDGSVPAAPGAAPTRFGVDRHRDDVAQALRAAGLDVSTAVGLSDFQVDVAAGPPGQAPSLAILLDSPAWGARLTTSDRDALPTTVLHRVMGWPDVARVWLPAWLQDRDGVVGDLVRRAYAAADRPSASMAAGAVRTTAQGDGPSVADAPTTDPLVGDVPVGEADPVGLKPEQRVDEPFVAYVSDTLPRGSIDDLTSPSRVGPVQQLMRDIVAAEGPLSVERLARTVARTHGLTRVTRERMGALAQVVPADLQRDPEEGFVWPTTRDPLQWNGFRRYDGSLKDRPLEDVALREVANALVFVAAGAMGIEVDELFRETYRLLGGSRVTAPARTRLAAALDLATREERVSVSADIVSPR